MGYLFFPPPQPFMGGHQPLAPGELSPSIADVPVDNPIRATVSAAILAVLIQSWQPTIPNAQARSFVVQDGTVAVASVPFARSQLHIAAAWQTPQPYQLYPKTIVSVDNPPPSSSFDDDQLAQIISAWLPPPPYVYPQPKQVVQVVSTSDNPPFSLAARTPIYQAIARLWDAPAPSPFIGGWQPLDPRNLAPPITAVPVDNPPPYSAFDDDLLAQLVSAWQVPVVPTQRWRFVPQQQIASADNPPPNLFDDDLLVQIVAAWQPVQPPRLKQNLPPSITAVRVDNPPPASRARATPIQSAWVQQAPVPWQQRYAPIPPAAIVSIPSGAIDDDLLVQIVGAWQPSAPYVQQRPQQVISGVVAPVTFDESRIYTVAPVDRTFDVGPFVCTFTITPVDRTYTVAVVSYEFTVSGPG